MPVYKRKDRRDEWWVRFHHPIKLGVRIHRRSPIQRRREAEAFERRLLEELMNPQTEIKQKEVPTLQAYSHEFVEVYAKTHNKPSEVHNKEMLLQRYLLPYLGPKRLNEIGRRDVDRMKAMLLKKELSPKTVNNTVAVLSRLLRYAHETEVIAVAPPRFGFLKVPRQKFDYLSFDEAERLLDSAKLVKPEWYAMIFTALRTGLRYGELCELRWEDVDLVTGRLCVQRNFAGGVVTSPKNYRSREVPLSLETIRVLKAHRHLKGALVFSKPDGGRRIHRRADVALKMVCRRAGLRSIGWHVFRHTFASHLAMRGRSLMEIKELLGHSDYSQTLRYAHLCPAVKRDAISVLDEPIPCKKWDPNDTQEGVFA